MRKYSIIDAVFLSFYSGKLYRDVIEKWQGMGMAYLLTVMIVFSLPELAQMQRKVTDWVVSKGPGIAAQTPTMDFSGGKLHFKGNNPYTIKDPISDKPLVMIDSTMTDFSRIDSNLVAVIGAKSMLVNNGITFQILPLEKLKDRRLTAGDVQYWFDVVGNWFVIFMGPFLVLFSFVFEALTAMFLGLFLWIYIRYYDRSIPFTVALRTTVVAMTPMLFWQAFTGVLPEIYHSLDILNIPLGVIYLWYAAAVYRSTVLTNKK